MIQDFSIPEALVRADFTRLVFHLSFHDGFALNLEAILRLRRGLLLAAEEIDRRQNGPVPVATELFDPPLPLDPVARRRFQRPSPAFVIRPPLRQMGAIAAGETVALDVLFFGNGIGQIPLFLQVLDHLGGHGFFLGKGHFHTARIDVVDASGCPQPAWTAGEEMTTLVPLVCECRWWLQTRRIDSTQLTLDLQTPMRLLSTSRPLFHPDFGQMFPFMLRRVTSMLYAHCDLEVDLDPGLLLETAQAVACVAQDLRWEDWRTLSGKQDLGGVVGRLTLAGDGLAELVWVIELAALMQVGKGATYGAGYYEIVTDAHGG